MVISVETFSRIAKLGGSGEVTVANQAPRNEGTIGNRFVAFFRGIGEALGFLKSGPSREQQQKIAFSAFKEALSGRFGEGIVVQSRLERANMTILNAVYPGLGLGGRATGSPGWWKL